MTDKSDGQLSFDLASPTSVSNVADQLHSDAVLSLCTFREKREEAERARYFSEIIKLADHLQRKY